MNTVMTHLMHSDDSSATERFGEQLGRNLRGGEVIELTSDLGGGKTTLTRGIAHGAGSSDIVSSPTFMISKIYKAQRFDIYHYDFYRLGEAGIMEYELHNALTDLQAVIVIEWGEVVAHILPDKRLTIRINKNINDSRELECNYPENLNYLMANT